MFSLNSGLNSKAVKTELDEIFFGRYSEPPRKAGFGHASTPDLFVQAAMQSSATIISEHMGPGKFIRHREEQEVQETSPRTANKTTHEVRDWKLNLPIPREFDRDDQHGLVQRDVKDMARQARNSQDENAFDIYAGGFDDATTPDAAYLWSDGHTNLNGDTIDNLETGTLTPNNFEVLVRKLYEQKDQRGRLGGHDSSSALFPPALIKKALQITESELEPKTTDNERNYISMVYPELRVFQSPWVGGTYHSYTNANTSYYLVGREHFITRDKREDLFTVLTPWQNDDKDRLIYKARYAETYYAGTWEGAVASNGTV